MADPLRILVLGASYGLLPGIKAALAGHEVTFVTWAKDIETIGNGPLELVLPLRRPDGEAVLAVPVGDQARPGIAAMLAPEDADPDRCDLVILAMQEPQFAATEIAGLLDRIGKAGIPCLSIMNLPPPPFLRRLGVPEACFEGVFSSGKMWDSLDPQRVALASPDPQAIRKDAGLPGRLTVTLASNFKAARFPLEQDQSKLERLAQDWASLKAIHEGAQQRLPVHLRIASSPFAAISKWPMLITGNCRCFDANGTLRSIAEAVHRDLGASEALYASVVELLRAMGADEADLVPFASYAKAARALTAPSSGARALDAGATRIERIDRLVLNLMQHHFLDAGEVAGIVAAIDQRLARSGAWWQGRQS